MLKLPILPVFLDEISITYISESEHPTGECKDRLDRMISNGFIVRYLCGGEPFSGKIAVAVGSLIWVGGDDLAKLALICHKTQTWKWQDGGWIMANY